MHVCRDLSVVFCVFGNILECFWWFKKVISCVWSALARRRAGFKRFFPLQFGAELMIVCAGAWVLRVFMFRDAILVRRRVGFKRFYVVGFNFGAQARGF